MDTGGQKLKDVSYIQVDFNPSLGVDLIFDGLRATEELGRPFLFEIDMTIGEAIADPVKLVGATASISLSRSDPGSGDTNKYLHGYVTRVISEGLARGSYSYRLEVRPWIWLLSRVTDSLIFQNMSAFDIITKVFREAGFSDFSDSRQKSAGSTVLEYCVQYQETTLDFVTRLMEEYGIYYYFKHEKTKHTLVFADDPNSHTERPTAVPYQFDQTEMRSVEDHVWEWIGEYALKSGKYTARDYNFTTPSADLTSKTVKPATHPRGSYEVYEYPGLYTDPGEGQSHTDVRMQAIVAERVLFHGMSNCRLLLAGWKFKLAKHNDKSLNKGYLITRSEVAISLAEGMSTDQDDGETIDTYRVVLHAIPGDVPFRLPRTTRRPQIHGPQTAKVVGTEGDEVTTDQYGRVKVKFHWDRSETQDDQRTCWIRVAQSWSGKSWGTIFIPRIGMEVVVEFLEGNPDRPLITGCVYNASQTVPYSLPGDKTKSTLKTNSSTGGGGFNELRFEDKKGSEEVFFQAQKDYNKKVLNNETVEITKDTTTTVKEGNRSVTVSQGNNSLTVSQGNNSVTVSQGNDSLTVSTGNHSITVSTGKSDINATTSITLTSGPSTVKISPSGVEITAPTVKITANATLEATSSASMTLNGGGSMALSAGMISIN